MRNLLLVLLIMMSLSLHGKEDSLRSSYGIFGNFLLNLHDADFRRIPDCPNCSPGFRSGMGAGPAFGLLYEYPLNKTFSVGSRLSYQNISGLLKATESTTVIVNSTAVAGEFEHTFDSDLNIFGLEPYLLYKAYDKISVQFGLNISTLLTKEYSQKEEITLPKNSATFLDADGNDSFSRRRNEFSGELQSAASIFIAPILGVSYELPLNNDGTLKAFPEISYQLGISNIVDDNLVKQWTVSSLRAGVALKYTPKYKKAKIKQYEKIELIDTVYIENDLIVERQFKAGASKTTIDKNEDDDFIVEISNIRRTDTVFTPKTFAVKAKINAVGLTEKLEEVPTPKFVIEEFSTARLQPLLNYIFFDSLSSKLDERYTRISSSDAQKFSVDSLYDFDVISTYRHLLNIIGKRMNDNPKANITLTGCNDGSGERNNLTLSEERANTIKKYLVDTWKINSSRITVKSRNLPEKSSTPLTDSEKAQENRRVEIISDNPEITKPVFASYNTRTISIPGIRLKPEINAEAGLKSWEITVKQDKKTLKFFTNNNGKVKNVDWMFSDDKRSIPVLDKPLELILKAEDGRGNSHQSEPVFLDIEQITVQKKRESGISDKQIDNYSLILFDFDKSDISSSNREIINFVKSRLQPGSKIEITGYTDRTGDEDYNRRLSERRASTVNSELKNASSTFKGIGKEILLYDNNFPEGRFYCRTVNIRVEREIK